MASKKSGNNKPEKKESQIGLVIYRVVFVVVSLILLFSLIFSAVATF
jgi:hypothetical protein